MVLPDKRILPWDGELEFCLHQQQKQGPEGNRHKGAKGPPSVPFSATELLFTRRYEVPVTVVTLY